MGHFLWEDFSSDDRDRGVEVTIPFRGDLLPFRIKRSLTIDERQKANQAAIEITLDKDGRPKLTRQDQAAFTKEVVLIGLKAWPFEYGPGKPVPITPRTIAQLDGGLLSEIAGRILGAVEVQKEDLDPFERASGDRSSPEEPADQS